MIIQFVIGQERISGWLEVSGVFLNAQATLAGIGLNQRCGCGRCARDRPALSTKASGA